MPFSHHSHSGQFCKHAKDTLEEMIQTAISKSMQSFALTEHMPRDVEDFYPEEIDDYPDAQSLALVSDAFYEEAHRLRSKYEHQINLPIGFETEWIRPSSLNLIRDFQGKFKFDFFVGSVHHVHMIPIDFNRALYESSRRKAGGGDEKLFEDYFDVQYDMLQSLKPPVVGHFDLIRLLSDKPNGSLQQFHGVWSRILRNLDFVAEYGGLLEINSSALRKGLKEPYPKIEVCQEFVHRGGGFVLSDDSHGIDQVATNYERIVSSIEAAGIQHLYACRRVDASNSGNEASEASFDFVRLEMSAVKELAFWSKI